MAHTSALTESDVFKVLRAYVQSLVDCEVIQSQVNRAAMPKGEFVAMTALSLAPIETNIHSVTWDAELIKTPSQMAIQIDCYGKESGANAQAISALFRDDYACKFFADSGFDLQPLYASDPQQMPLINGEDQYEKRWFFTVNIQVNHSIDLSKETAKMIAIGTPPVNQQIGTVYINSDGINKVD